MKLGNKKSRGTENIAGEALKLGGTEIARYQKLIFNASLNNYPLPLHWRVKAFFPAFYWLLKVDIQK